MKTKVLISLLIIEIILISNLGFAQTLNELEIESINKYNIEQTKKAQSANYSHTSSPCINASWNGDNYCLWAGGAEIQPPTDILNQIKSKILKTISEEYFNEHFDLVRVDVKGVNLKYNDSSSWMMLSLIAKFNYRIADYEFEYNIYLTNDTGKLIFENYNAPREIKNVVDKNFVENEADYCIGKTKVRYSIKPNFVLTASGEGNGKYMNINLETNEVTCREVRYNISSGLETKSTRSFKDWIIIGAIVSIFLISLVIVKFHK